MASREHVHAGEQCSCALQPTGAQSIVVNSFSPSLKVSSLCVWLAQELEFERGIWSAAMDGETERVKKFLARGLDPSSIDSAGYTALVISSL